MSPKVTPNPNNKITLSVIKADVGGYVGHSSMHPDLMAKAEKTRDKGA